MNDTPSTHAARASLYATTATVLAYPTDETVEDLTDPDATAGIRSAADRLGFDAEAEALLSALESTTRSRLESVYDHLFGIPDGGSYPVVPYEAAYTVGGETDQKQRRIATVVGLMEAFGVEPSADFTERQDHIAAELELAQVLAAQRAVALDRGDADGADRLEQAEATFLAEHLVDFLAPFADRVRDATDSDTYLAAVDLADALVTWDHAAHPAPSVTLGQYAAGEEVRPDA